MNMPRQMANASWCPEWFESSLSLLMRAALDVALDICSCLLNAQCPLNERINFFNVHKKLKTTIIGCTANTTMKRLVDWLLQSHSQIAFPHPKQIEQSHSWSSSPHLLHFWMEWIYLFSITEIRFSNAIIINFKSSISADDISYYYWVQFCFKWWYFENYNWMQVDTSGYKWI